MDVDTEVELVRLGRRLRMYRKAANMTQVELGEKLGLSGSALSHWEIGNPPKSPAYRKLAEAWVEEQRKAGIKAHVVSKMTFPKAAIEACTVEGPDREALKQLMRLKA